MTQLLAALTYAAVFGNVFFAAFVAATPGDHSLPWWLVSGVAGLNALAHALPGDGLPLPKAAAVKAALLLPLFLIGSGLAGCAALGLTGQPANDLPKISADALAIVNAACADYAPFGAAAMLAPDPKVRAIALTTNGMCDLATGQVLPGAVAKIDPSTAAWIGASVGMIKALGVVPAKAV